MRHLPVAGVQPTRSTPKPARLAMRYAAGTVALTALVVAGLPGAASAHGIDGAGGSVASFVWTGFTHMLLGWDHLLFIIGVVLLAGSVKRAATMISIFALGHSTTLIIATLAGWHVSARAVDVVIALSLVFVGLAGWFGAQKHWRLFGAGVFAFGLVHGLGLSTRLQDLGLHEDGLLPRIIAFNIGIELGQLLAVAAVFMLGDVLSHYVRVPQFRRVANVGLIAVGVVAASTLTIIRFTEERNRPELASPYGACQVRERTETFPGGGGGHPRKDFYEPNETADEKDFGHVIGDGYIIVHYQPSLPLDKLSPLRDFVSGPDGGGVVAGAAPGQTEAVKAINAYDTLVCAEYDLTALQTFVQAWFADPRSRQLGQ